MRGRIVAIVGCLVLVAGASATADDRANAVLKRIEGAYRAARTMRAEVVGQTEVHGRTEVFAGTFTGQKPNAMRYAMSKPVAELIVVDGRTASVYLSARNQYVTAPASEVNGPTSGTTDFTGTFVLSVFFSPSLLRKLGNLVYGGGESVDGVPCDILSVKGPGVSETKVYVQANGIIRRSTVVTKTDGITTTTRAMLHNIVLNRRVPRSAFQFTPPRTAKLLDFDASLLKVGTAAPAFVMPTPSGGTVSLADASRGRKAVLVNFWFYG